MWICPNCLTRNEGATCSNCNTRRIDEAASATRSVSHRMLTRSEIKERAKASLSEQRSNAVLNWLLPTAFFIAVIALISSISGGFSLLPMLISAAESGSAEDAAYAALDMVSMVLGTSALITVLTALINFVAIPVVSCAQCYNALRLYREKKMQISDLILGFKRNFLHVWGGSLWRALFVFLWGLIPVVGPFIVFIKTYAYAMTPYILMTRPGVDAKEALKLSIKMTEGHKMDLFVLDLSFIGWHLLNYLTFGILGILFVIPYEGIAHAGYYDELETAFCGGRVPLPESEEGGKSGREVTPGKSWKCPKCGLINNETYCTRCGTKRVDDVPEPPVGPDKSWKCPKCGRVNEGSFCTTCGTGRDGKSWKCPKCGTVNTGAFCTNCAPEPPTKFWKCPKCGALNTGEFCMFCYTGPDAKSWKCRCGSINVDSHCPACGADRPVPPVIEPGFGHGPHDEGFQPPEDL